MFSSDLVRISRIKSGFVELCLFVEIIGVISNAKEVIVNVI